MYHRDLPKISIVVPVFNSAATISKCLDGCLQQEYEGEIEVIAVDDGSTDGSEQLIKNYSVLYIYQQNKGPATARNNGWQNSTGSIICFTDSDCIPDKQWVKFLVENFSDENIAGVGGTYGIANPESLLAKCVHEEIIERHRAMPKYVNYVGSFNVAYRTSVLRQVRGFDESYRFASGEDTDLAYRIHKTGYKLVFDSRAKVSHHHPTNISNYLRSQFRHGIWRVKLYKHHKDMLSGDVYSSFTDHIQPPLALILIGLVPLLWVPWILELFLALALAQLLLQLPLTLRIMKRAKKPQLIIFALITFLRTFARGIGFMYGMIKFLPD